MNKLELMKTANEVRKGIVTAVHSAKAGHPGGSLSAADIFTYLYFEEMNIDPSEPKKADRDRFVLSKGHTAPGLYSVLAQRGYFPVEDLKTLREMNIDPSEPKKADRDRFVLSKGHTAPGLYSVLAQRGYFPVEDLKTLRHTGSYLQGHPDMKHIPGVDMSSGSLGQGISAAVGMAIAGKLDNADYRVYTLLGDGEIQEGQVWEASMLAAHKKLDNLVINIDGNDFDQIDAAFKEAKTVKGCPTAIIAKTIKGKDVSFMENQAGWHGKAPNDEEYAVAMADL